MKILFTTRDEWFSNTIKDLTAEPVSHCALEFPEHGFVIHSNIKGVHLEWSKNFRRKNIVVYEIDWPEEDSLLKIDRLLSQYEFSRYDCAAICFLGIKMAIRRHLRISLPKSNLWQSTGMFLCTEWVTKYVNGEEDSMITPYKLYLKLRRVRWLEQADCQRDK